MGHMDSELNQICNIGLETKVEVNDEVKMDVNLVKNDWTRSNRWIRSTRFILGQVGLG